MENPSEKWGGLGGKPLWTLYVVVVFVVVGFFYVFGAFFVVFFDFF